MKENKGLLIASIFLKVMAIYLLYTALKDKSGNEQTLWIFMGVGAWAIAPAEPFEREP